MPIIRRNEMRRCVCGSYAVNLAKHDKTKDICDVCYYKIPLMNLLAYIHRDGGHYTAEHGLEKSVKDAKEVINNFNLSFR